MMLHDVINSLQMEKQGNVPSRFPCRAIMVKNIEQYCTLLSQLRRISDIRFVRSDEIIAGADVLPQYENLRDGKYWNQWLVLTGVSEYLRLFSKKEAVDRRFSKLWCYQAPASSTGRIIIPLWGCEAEWFDASLELNGDLRQDEFYYDCSDSDASEQKMELLVLSDVFEPHLSKMEKMSGYLRTGMREWFEYWENPSPNNTQFLLLTRFCKQLITRTGTITIRPMRNVLAYIQENMAGANVLTSENCDEDMQDLLFAYALRGSSLDDALLGLLNVSRFSGSDIMRKWETMSAHYRRFVALWLKLYPDGTYLSHCFSITDDLADIPNAVLLEIFKVRSQRPDWVSEYRILSSAMNLRPNKEFFRALDEMPVYEERLRYIGGETQVERIYLLRMVGKWMRKDPNQVRASGTLKRIYPELYAYLCENGDILDDNMAGYISLYKAYKLENTLPTDEDCYFAGISTETFDSRYSVLSDNMDPGTTVLWIDALGVEWLALLVWGIRKNCDATVRKVGIAQATLPTETCFNDQWNQIRANCDKLDKLDKLAHKGVIDEPDYYACIEEQIFFVSGIYRRVNELLTKYHRVIITGDHGTSRLAARFFHTRDGIAAPKNAKVRSYGRYCELSSDVRLASPNICVIKHQSGEQYAVFKNYDHFVQSGFAAGADDDNAVYGEVHGGATPEEMLVPIIVIDSNKEIPLTATWESRSVKIAMRKAKLALHFSRPVHRLMVSVANVHGDVSTNDDGLSWAVTLAGIRANPSPYTVTAVADQQILSLPDITIQPALGDGDDLP